MIVVFHITVCLLASYYTEYVCQIDIIIQNIEYEVMVAGGEKIVEALSRDPKGLAQAMFTKGLISHAILEETNELNETKTDKARRLYSVLSKVVQEYPEQYDDFIGVFKMKSGQYDNFLIFLKSLHRGKGKCISFLVVVHGYYNYDIYSSK